LIDAINETYQGVIDAYKLAAIGLEPSLEVLGISEGGAE
jgi:hypothetical protein